LSVFSTRVKNSTFQGQPHKAGKDRKIKLPPATAAVFETAAKGKLPTAPLFARADGKAWNKDAWKHPFRDAADAAKLPADATMYVIRHSTITDLVHGGLDLLTVAQISGTSVRMIEAHYGHPECGPARLLGRREPQASH
jgi:site-specific recombinase XerD